MRAFFWRVMENYQAGDLTDILRATTCGGNNNDVAAPDNNHFSSASSSYDWQFQSDPISFPTDPVDDFGDPFSHLGDPLLHYADNPIITFHNAADEATMMKNRDSAVEGFERNKGRVLDPDFDDETTMIKRHGPNIFSRMLQISPTTSAKLPLSTSSDRHQPFIDSTGSASKISHRAAALVANDRHHHPHNRVLNISSRANCSVESPNLQISSPRNTGIKRRKSQTKKVVCIPAPTPANSSRASGEIVPSDLWAWRKYGQKPIKGSPYPRGYYRCSSSKGCLARKQVERSRTDPNMLVITYTSEHNHPWPTQRNALAGSTRSQQSKNIANSNELKAHEKPKEGPNHKSSVDRDHASSSMNTDLDHFDDSQLEIDQDQEFLNDGLLFPRGYKPTLQQDKNNVAEDQCFFAELHDIDQGSNSLDVLFKQGFNGTDDEDDDDVGSDQILNKGLDPFSFYDWSGTNNAKSTISSAGGTTPNNKEDS